MLFCIHDIKLEVQTNDSEIQRLGVPAGVPCAMLDYAHKWSKDATIDGVVLVPSAFWDLSPSTMEAVLTHEAGHAFYNHLDQFPDDGSVIECDHIEAEADAYAASIIGITAFDAAMREVLHATLNAVNIDVDSIDGYLTMGAWEQRADRYKVLMIADCA